MSVDNNILGQLDAQTKFFIWTKGELLMILGPFFVSVFFDAFLLGCVACVVNSMGIKAFKRHFGKGRLKKVRYRYLPPSKVLKALPPSHIPEFR